MAKEKLTGGEAIAKYMKAQGIPYTAGIPGHGCLALTDAFKKHDIPVIQVRHEQSAAHLADGFYRTTGKPLVVFTSIVMLGLVQSRFWCRNLCPLGALLGLFSRFGPLRVQIGRRVSEACTSCSLCSRRCPMGAIPEDFTSTWTAECIQCQTCSAVCPEGAIRETDRELGVLEKGHKYNIEFVHGRLRVGEAMSPPLIKKVREYEEVDKLTIIDAPPGTSCPVIASMKGADFIILVTEPTPFGLHDLKLAAGAVKLLKIPCGIVINRSDLGNNKVKDFAEKEKIPVVV